MKPLFIASTFPIEDNQFQKNDTLVSCGNTGIVAADPMQVKTFAEMTDMVAKLAWFNKSHVLFFRGQTKEYKIGNRFPTIYPTYFRKYIKKEMSEQELKDILSEKQEELKEKNHNRKPRFHGASSVFGNLHIRWALLQHYNICDTPLIDVTQSLHVASSFALEHKDEKYADCKGIIYVLALPWPSKNYHNNKEEDIYLVRLAGVAPPQAKRPYRQEAFAVMSTDVDIKQFDRLERYDFAKRLVCKFEINNSNEFWGDYLKPLPESFLVPRDDIFYDFMKNEVESSIFVR
jgi:hypothetical protein